MTLLDILQKNKKDIIFFDIETTGLNVDSDRIVELAAIKYTADEGMMVKHETIDLLLNPEIQISTEASAIHGFTNEGLKDKPTFKDYSTMLFCFFSKNNPIIAGFNHVAFDIPLLVNEFARAGLEFQGTHFVDILNIFKIKERRTLEDTYRFYLKSDMEYAHNALADTTATIEVFLKQIEIYNLGETIDDLQAASGLEGLVDFAGKLKKDGDDIVYNFGKNAGKKVLDYPDYAKWMLANDFPEDTKRHLRKITK